MLWVENLDDSGPGSLRDAVQSAMLIVLKGLGLRATGWFLHPRRLAEPIKALIERLTPAVALLRSSTHPSSLRWAFWLKNSWMAKRSHCSSWPTAKT